MYNVVIHLSTEYIQRRKCSEMFFVIFKVYSISSVIGKKRERAREGERGGKRGREGKKERGKGKRGERDMERR